MYKINFQELSGGRLAIPLEKDTKFKGINGQPNYLILQNNGEVDYNALFPNEKGERVQQVCIPMRFIMVNRITLESGRIDQTDFTLKNSQELFPVVHLGLLSNMDAVIKGVSAINNFLSMIPYEKGSKLDGFVPKVDVKKATLIGEENVIRGLLLDINRMGFRFRENLDDYLKEKAPKHNTESLSKYQEGLNKLPTYKKQHTPEWKKIERP